MTLIVLFCGYSAKCLFRGFCLRPVLSSDFLFCCMFSFFQSLLFLEVDSSFDFDSITFGLLFPYILFICVFVGVIDSVLYVVFLKI